MNINKSDDINSTQNLSSESETSLNDSTTYQIPMRYDYLDNLRALALLLGVFFHTAIAYSLYMNEFWVTAAPEKSTLLESLAFFTHLFRMPLFMLIAGFFGCYLYQKRGMKGFIKNRSLRIVLPFFVFFPVLMACYVGVFIYGIKHLEHKSPLLQLVSTFATNPSARLNMPISTMHLWFLFNLIFFYCVTLLLVKLNLFDIKKFISSCSTKTTRLLILLVLPLLLVPSFYSQFAPPLNMPDHVYPQLWSFGYYGVFFVMGWILFSSQYLLDAISDYWKPMLLVSVIAYALVYSVYPRTISLTAIIDPKGYVIPNHLLHLGMSILHAFISVYMVFVLLSLGKKFLNYKNAFLNYLSQSSYWVYLIHLPIILAIQVVLLDKDWNMWLKFFMTMGLAFILSILSYQVLVRYAPIGWMLNGRINKKKN